MVIGICIGTVLLMIISVLLNLQLKIGKIKLSLYWIIVLVGAIALIIFRGVKFNDAISGIVGNSKMNPVKILILFLSMTGISVFLDTVGFFDKLASMAVKRAGKSKLRLFIYIYLTVSVLTVFTSNDVIILTFTPFICYFCKSVKTNPMPLLFCEFVGANTWSMFFIFGNPTNVYLSASLGVNFGKYFVSMALPTVCAGVTSFLCLLAVFYKDLKKPLEYNAEEDEKELQKPLVVMGVIALAVCIALMVVSDYIGLEMQYISLGAFVILMICACVYILIKKVGFKPIGETFKRLPYALIPFLLSMFIIVLSLEKNGYIDKFCNALNSIGGGKYVYGISSFLSCNVINNIPMSVLFEKIISCGVIDKGAVFGTVIGSNLGAILTPIGALAGIMWMNLCNRYQVKVNFLDFVKYGVIISVPTLAVALLVL